MGYFDGLKKTLQDNLSSNGIAGALSVVSSDNIESSIPGSLLKLNSLVIEDLKVNIDINAIQTSSLNLVIGFKPNEDGTPRYWQILSTPKLNVGKFRFGFGITTFRSEIFPPPCMWNAYVQGNIAIGEHHELNTMLRVPSSGDWILKIITESGNLPTVKELTDLIFTSKVTNTSPILSILPATLLNDGLVIVLDEIQFRFNPFTPEFGGLDFKLSQTGKWDILEQLSISDWSVKMDVDARNNYKITGLLQGCLQLGTVVDIAINLPFPADERGWTISLKEGTTIDFPGMGELLSLIGIRDIANRFPMGFDKLGNFSMNEFSVSIDTLAISINEFKFSMRSESPWVIWQDILSFSKVYAKLAIQKYAGAYDSTGIFSCFVDVLDNPIWIQAIKNKIGDPWIFQLATQQKIHIPGLSDLAKWMLPDKIAGYIPESFLPFGSGFDLTGLNFEFDITHNNLQTIEFDITNSDAWTIIPEFLSLDKVIVTVRISSTVSNDLSDYSVQTSISAVLSIGDADIIFRGVYVPASPHWTFEASLTEKIKFNFSDLLSALHLDELFYIPDISGLPALVVSTLSGKLIPETKYLLFDCFVLLVDNKVPVTDSLEPDWTIDFLGLHFNMFGLTAHVEREQSEEEKDENGSCFKVILFSVLDLNTLKLELGMQLGPKGVDQVFTGALSLKQVQQLSLKQWADGLVNGNLADSKKWDELVPNDMASLEYASAYVYYNYTQQFFALYGQVRGLGDGIFISQATKVGKETERGYIFAFSLGDDFKFGDWFAALAPIDSVLTISEASLVINSYSVESADVLVQQIGQVVSVTNKPGSVIQPVQRTSLPAGIVSPGVHMYARLQLSGPLFSLFSQLNDNSEGLDVTLYASFPTQSATRTGSGETIFNAVFAPFSMFGGVMFFKGAEGEVGVIMTYQKLDIPEFSLFGIIGFNAFGNSYEFTGRLVVNNDKTRFSVTTPPDQSIVVPLFSTHLPPLFILKDIGLDVIYYFQTENRKDKYLELNLNGQVEILNAVFVNANLYLVNGTPVLAILKLDRDFSISELLGSLTGSQQVWPSDLFDITFKAETDKKVSRIYYYDAAKDVSPVRYPDFSDGFNLETTVEFTLIATICINLRINIRKDEGIEADAGLDEPIRIFALELAGKQKGESKHKKYAGSPVFRLSTVGGSTKLGLSTGINFFEYPFGIADITFQNRRVDVGQSELKIGARLVADESIPIFGKFSVDFTYCRSEGFVIGNLPNFKQVYDSLSEVIDIADEITKIMKEADPKFVCGAIIDLVSGVAYENRFDIKPSLSASETSLSLNLDGTFMVYVVGVEVTSIGFPKMLSIPLPDGASFDNWGGYIQEAIKNAAGSFVDQLRRNSKEWAKLAGVIFSEQAAELVAQMLCQGLIDAAAAAAAAAAAEVIQSAGGTVAIAAGGTVAASIIKKAIESSNKKHDESEGGDKPGPDPEPTPSPDPEPKPDPEPSIPQLVAEPFVYSKEQLILSWYGSTFAAGYELEFYAPSGGQIGKTQFFDMRTFSASISLPVDSEAGYYKAKLRSIRQNKKSEWVEASIYKLKAPSNVQLSFCDDKFEGLWDQVEENCGYKVMLYHAGTLLSQYVTEADVNSLVICLSDLSLNSGSFTIAVATIGNKKVIESGLSKHCQPCTVDMSQIPVLCLYDNLLSISGVGGNTALELFDVDSGKPVRKPGIIKCENDTITIQLKYLLPHTIYRVKIQTENINWRSGTSQIISLCSSNIMASTGTLVLAVNTIVYSPMKSGCYNFTVGLLDKDHNQLELYNSGEVSMKSQWRRDFRQVTVDKTAVAVKVNYKSTNDDQIPPQGMCVLQLIDSYDWIEIIPNEGFPSLDFSFKL